MTDDALRLAYARAFIAQARSDWRVYARLSASGDAACHALHYLQMASEKLAKAYRLRETSSPVATIVSHHTGFTKFIRQYLLSARYREAYRGKTAQLHSLIQDAAKLATEIEKLAPAVERQNAPENVEYPWQVGDKVIAPCEWTFAALSLLKAPHGRAFLKTIDIALRDFDDLAAP
jgi:hypothetical protein